MTHDEQARMHFEAAAAALEKSQLSSPLLRTARRELAAGLRSDGRARLPVAEVRRRACRDALARVDAGRSALVGENLRSRLETAAGIQSSQKNEAGALSASIPAEKSRLFLPGVTGSDQLHLTDRPEGRCLVGPF